MTRTGLSAIAHEREGTVVEEILKTAQEISADLIVMGSHGHGPVYNLLVGSVTEGVLKAGPAPGPARARAGRWEISGCALRGAAYAPKRLRACARSNFSVRISFFLGAAVGLTNAATLPFQTVFKGREKFDYLVQQAAGEQLEIAPHRRSDGRGRPRAGRNPLQIVHARDRRSSRGALCEFFRNGLLDVF